MSHCPGWLVWLSDWSSKGAGGFLRTSDPLKKKHFPEEPGSDPDSVYIRQMGSGQVLTKKGHREKLLWEVKNRVRNLGNKVL